MYRNAAKGEPRHTQHTGQNLAKVGPVIPEIGPIHRVRAT